MITEGQAVTKCRQCGKHPKAVGKPTCDRCGAVRPLNVMDAKIAAAAVALLAMLEQTNKSTAYGAIGAVEEWYWAMTDNDCITDRKGVEHAVETAMEAAP